MDQNWDTTEEPIGRQCPRCLSSHIYPSRRRSSFENFIAVLGGEVLRCHVCNRRLARFGLATFQVGSPKQEGPFRPRRKPAATVAQKPRTNTNRLSTVAANACNQSVWNIASVHTKAPARPYFNVRAELKPAPLPEQLSPEASAAAERIRRKIGFRASELPAYLAQPARSQSASAPLAHLPQ